MCINKFLGVYVNEKVYPDFWYVCKFVFTLSHGQSAVECGFNINKHTLKMPPSLHCVQCMMKLFIMVALKIIHHGSIRPFSIDNFLLLSCNSLLVLDTRMTWNKEGSNL